MSNLRSAVPLQRAALSIAGLLPGIPTAHLVSSVENIAEAVIDHVAETDIDVLRPEHPHFWAGVGPGAVVAANMLGFSRARRKY